MKIYGLKNKYVNILLLLLILLFSFYFFVYRAGAATITWNGAGTEVTCGNGMSNNWSCGANWVGGSAPGFSDIANFDSTSTKDVTIDSAVSVLGIDINTGYTGQITQNASVTLGSSGFDQADGIWVGNAQTFDINGSFTISGGTNTPTTGTFTLTRNLTKSGGILNIADITITLNGSGLNDDSTITCTGTLGGIIQFAKEAYGDVTVASGCTVETTNINGVFGYITINGTLNHTGSTFNIDTYSSASGLVIAEGGTLTYSGTTITLESNLTKAGTFDLTGKTIALDGGATSDNSTITCAGTLGGIVQLVKDGLGTVTVASGCTVETTNINGVFGYITINGTLNHTGSTFNIDTITSNSGLIIPEGGTLTYSGTNITLESNLTKAGTFDLTGKTIALDGGGTIDHSIITCTGNLGGIVQFAKEGFGDITVSSGCTVETTSINGGFGYVTVNGTLNHTGSTFNFDTSAISSGLVIAEGGTLTYSGTTITLESSLTKNGTFDLIGKTITLDGAGSNDDSTVTCTGNLGGTVQFTKTGAGDVTVSSGCTVEATNINGSFGYVTVNGTLNHTGSTFNIDASGISTGLVIAEGGTLTYSGTTITLETSLTKNGTFDLTGKTITLDGTLSTDDSLIVCGTGVSIEGNVVINKTSADGITTFGSNCTINGSLTRTDGIVENSASPYTLKIEGNLSMSTTDAFGGSNLTIELSGGNLQTVSQNSANTFGSPLVINKSGNKAVLGTALDLGSNLTITAGELDTGTNYQINIAGNWSNSGTFTSNSGNVVFDGTSQSILGSTSFYNLTKNVSSADTLTFGAGATQTINGTMDLQGTSGNLLSLRSSNSPTRWIIDPQGTRTIAYLDVMDSNNINSAQIATEGFNITNSENNIGWDFGGEEPPEQQSSSTRLPVKIRGGLNISGLNVIVR